MGFTFRKALAIVVNDRQLTAADHAHLHRWRADEFADDPSWEQLATAARARDILPTKTIYESIIREALHMRRYAESVRSGIDFDLRERRQQHKRHLELAQKADDLAENYKWAEGYSGIANFFGRFLSPVAELRALHRKEAELLRQRAGRPPVSAARVSRQDVRGGLRRFGAGSGAGSRYIPGRRRACSRDGGGRRPPRKPPS